MHTLRQLPRTSGSASSARLAAVSTALVIAALLPTTLRAEGAGHQGPSSTSRVRGAIELVSAGNGLVTVGGSRIRYLAPHASSWQLLLRRGGHNAGVVADPQGRVLAWWENEPAIHYVGVNPRRVLTRELPEALMSAGSSAYSIRSAELSPDHRRAMIYLRTLPGNRSQQHRARAVQVSLRADSPPKVLYEVEGRMLWSSPRGAVFQLPLPGEGCGYSRCVTGRVIAYAVTGRGVKTTTLLDRASQPFGGVTVVPGSNDEALVLLVRSGPEQSLMRFRWRDQVPYSRKLAKDAIPTMSTLIGLSARAGHLVYVRDAGGGYEVVRVAIESREPRESPPRPTPPAQTPTAEGEQPATLSALARLNSGGTGQRYGPHLGLGNKSPFHDARVSRPANTRRGGKLFGKGLRRNGSVWMHRGDTLFLIATDGRTRTVDLAELVGGRPEWGGSAAYVEKPEMLWVAVEIGSGRDFVGLRFATLERLATPLRMWPVEKGSKREIEDRRRERDRQDRLLGLPRGGRSSTVDPR